MNRLILAAALICMTTGAAQAQDVPGPAPEHGPDGDHGRGPGRPDPYGDATVSRADVLAKSEADFAKLDADHDGFLSADEFSAQFPEDSRMRMMAPMMMTRFDTDGDGKLSKSEFTATALKRFDDADANHDGQLTKAERDAAREAMRARFRDHGGRHHGGDGGGDGGPPPGDGGPPPGDGGPPPGDGGPPPGGPGGDDGPPPPPGQ